MEDVEVKEKWRMSKQAWEKEKSRSQETWTPATSTPAAVRFSSTDGAVSICTGLRTTTASDPLLCSRKCFRDLLTLSLRLAPHSPTTRVKTGFLSPVALRSQKGPFFSHLKKKRSRRLFVSFCSSISFSSHERRLSHLKTEEYWNVSLFSARCLRVSWVNILPLLRSKWSDPYVLDFALW